MIWQRGFCYYTFDERWYNRCKAMFDQASCKVKSVSVYTEVDPDVVCAYYQGRPDDVHRFNCKTRMYGRYVRVTILTTNSLTLYEIEVIGFI